MSRVCIFGATSAIAEAVARLYAAQGAELLLCGRDEQRLSAIASDLKVRGARDCKIQQYDAADMDAQSAAAEQAWQAYNGLDVVLIAHGTLSDQMACQQDDAVARRELDINFVSAVALLTPLANQFEKQGFGSIAVISSVAGDRGRQSNYLYGSAKAGLSAFLSGLRNRLHHCGVQVLTIKPGFVDTPMTAHLDKGALWAQPEQVAKQIHKAIGGSRSVIYTPGIWWAIMLIIKHIPEVVFKRLNL